MKTFILLSLFAFTAAAADDPSPGTITPVDTETLPEISVVAPAAESVTLPDGPITLYAAGNYRLRKSEWGAIQGIIPKGKTFEVLGRGKKDFYRIRYNGKIGYVHRNGLDHPLAQAIKAQEGLQGLKRYEAAEIAACMAAIDGNAIAPDMKDFFQRVHASLESYRDKEPKAEPVPRLPAQQVKSVKVAEKPATGLTATTTSAPQSVLVPLPPPRMVSSKGQLLPRGASKEEYEEKEEDPRASAIHPGRVAALSIAADRASKKCRRYANFVCRGRGLCGVSCNPGKSKGMCKAGVREAIQEAYGFHLPGGSAAASNAALRKSPKFTRIAATSCADAPVGAICVYDASHHNFGHIEVKAGANKYCSDYCAARPVSKRSYKVKAIYVPRYDT